MMGIVLAPSIVLPPQMMMVMMMLMMMMMLPSPRAGLDSPECPTGRASKIVKGGHMGAQGSTWEHMGGSHARRSQFIPGKLPP